MSLTFYYAPLSTAAVTRLVLEELSVPFDIVAVDLRKGESRTPHFLELNPNGKVPVLVHDDVALWESAAITLYLGETFGVDRHLFPPPGPHRGEAMKWIVWANVTLGEAIGRYARHAFDWAPADERNAKAGESGLRDLRNCLSILDAALSRRTFLVDTYTLADAHVCSFMDWLAHMRIDLSEYTHLSAWAGRCRARPAYARATSSAP